MNITEEWEDGRILLPITSTILYMYRNRPVIDTVFGLISQKVLKLVFFFLFHLYEPYNDHVRFFYVNLI
jgi:hypothetical protein